MCARSLQSRTKSADDLRSPTPSEKESRIASTQSSNQLDHTGRRPPSGPSSISSSQLLDSQTPAKRAASNSTLDSGHGSCRSPRSPSAASTDSKGNKQRCPFTKQYRVEWSSLFTLVSFVNSCVQCRRTYVLVAIKNLSGRKLENVPFKDIIKVQFWYVTGRGPV